MNYIGFDAMAAGNHEFDRGPKVFAEFLRLATFPALAANVDVSDDPDLKHLLKPSAILEIGGEKVGVVGAITPDLPTISSPGPHLRMKPYFESLQSEVDALATQGINKIILVSHSGYELEKEVASKVRGIDVIVGGHSHTPLGEQPSPNLPAGQGSYPTVQKDPNGDTVLVLQAYQWGMVLGNIRVDFDAAGRVVGWSDTPPIALDAGFPDDPVMAAMIAAYRKPIEALANEVIGNSESGIPRGAFAEESPMGNMIADSQLAYCKSMGAVAAFMNNGGIRASLEAGEITYGAAIAVQPFNNTLIVMELTGEQIKQVLEWGVRELPEGTGGLIHVSHGSSYVADKSRPVGDRVVEIRIAGEALDPSRTYRIVVNSFLAAGGDAHEVLKNATGERIDTGFLDIDAFVDYLKANTPVTAKREGRIVIR
jgi:5'-nucleotidase